MTSLTHVCMWSEKGWRRITAEEAARLHPGGTVSAHSGLFMCELCGQYVLLTDSCVRVRHFRHSSSEKSKDCPERVSGVGVKYDYFKRDYELPIRIVNIKKCSFELEMGFIRVPQDLLTSQLQIVIKSCTQMFQPFVYTKERLCADGITYLSVGNIPSDCYDIEVTGTTGNIRQFWPEIVRGIDSKGTIFDSVTGKKLVYDADVVVGKKYYLLKKSSIYGVHGSHVTCKEISCQSMSWETWRIFEVMAKDYDEESARFFLDYHCRLTDQPISIQPIWPMHVENPYVIKHNQNSTVIHLTGNNPVMKVFPHASKREYPCENGLVIEVDCNSRQQLISAGRTKVLQYVYFWKEELHHTTERPVAIVTDINGTPISEGENNNLPECNTLYVLIPYDGILVIKQDNVLIEKRKLCANISTEVDCIAWKTELNVYVGLDVVWKSLFYKESALWNSADEIEILRRLESYNGMHVQISHTIGNLASRLIDYPLIRQWLYKNTRLGHMNKHAYRDLQMWIQAVELDK